MVWSNVAQLYMRSFELSRLEGAALPGSLFSRRPLDKARELPELKLDHLWQMTDSTAFAHAVFSVPIFPKDIAPMTMPRIYPGGAAQ